MDLELKGVTKRFGGFVAVRGVSFSVARGQFVCLLGPSGCGKTTTLRAVAGLEDVDEGEIWIGGQCVNDVPPWRRDIAMMFQDFALFPHMTVARQVAFGLEMARRPRDEIRRRVGEVLATFEIAHLAERKPDTLSGGQRQRVALARALITEPRILLLDEPIGNLDFSLRETVMLELKDVQRRLGISFVWVTHDQNEAFSLGDLVVVMNHARIEQQGPPEEILQRPATAFVAGFVQGNNVFRGRVKELLAGMLRIETPAGTFLVPRALAAPPPMLGSEVSFSVRAELITDAVFERHINRLSAVCTAVEYFGAVRRHVFERSDGEVLKYDQFGAHAARIVPGQQTVLGWPAEAAVLHAGAGG
jgi:ABC-type Fe3+/spermidine/putrescine transport system ATPase subunit